jgi:hypothetical protein
MTGRKDPALQSKAVGAETLSIMTIIITTFSIITIELKLSRINQVYYR